MLAIIIFSLITLTSIKGYPQAKEVFVLDPKIFCANNGMGFSNGLGNSFCKCGPRTTGKQCQIIITPTTTPCAPTCNPCANNPCQYGTCSNVNCLAVCQCYTGYYGQNCQYLQQTTTPCVSTTTPCVTTRTTTPYTTTCALVISTTTPCAITTTTPCVTTTASCNPCAYNPCQNGGQCFNSNCNAVCQCNSGSYGTYCQYTMTTPAPFITTTPCVTTTSVSTMCNPCAISPCQNGGQCYNSNCNAVCQCNSGSYGTYCQYTMTTPAPMTTTPCAITTTTPCVTTTASCNPCAYNQCQNGGQCFNSNCNAVCRCNSGSYGTYCQYTMTTPAPFITTTPCVTTPAPVITTTPCAIISTTTPCAPSFNPCAVNPCQYGQCVNLNGRAFCNCFPGYSGQYCQTCSNVYLAKLYENQKKN